ncbi:MAG: type II toxin-antitoxin system VapC family toxin [Verrucomicrobiota bacterium]|jgi:predicted nucleic-acid-binding protein|nr:type II toxin-antitoxin system VapC family toxin [Verrucomicrobiota bacterium]
MTALDTNVLIRFLTADDPAQSKAVHQLFKTAETERLTYRVTVPVVLEVFWVLESAYELPRARIIEAVSGLLALSVLAFERADAVRDMLEDARRNTHDLSDLLIIWLASRSGDTLVLTFDKRAVRHPLFKLLR